MNLGSRTNAVPINTFPVWSPDSRNRNLRFQTMEVNVVDQSSTLNSLCLLDRFSGYSALQREAYGFEAKAWHGGARVGTCAPRSRQVSIIWGKQISLGMKRAACKVPRSHLKGPHLFSGSQEERRYLPGVEKYPVRTAPTLA